VFSLNFISWSRSSERYRWLWRSWTY